MQKKKETKLGKLRKSATAVAQQMPKIQLIY